MTENPDRKKELVAAFEEIENTAVWLDSLVADVSTEEVAAVYDRIGQLVKSLNLVADAYRMRLTDDFKQLGVKRATAYGLDGCKYSVEVVNRSTRTDVQRDDLVRTVERLAFDPVNRTDQLTGEVSSVEEARVRLLKSAFRFEPRWAEIEKLGLNDDEFCKKTWSASIKMEKEVTL